jgi:hypothetical protein
MQTRDSSKKQSEEEEGAEKRDLELENVVGNLLIATYQVEKLRTRLADLVDGFRPELEMRFNKSSAHIFKHNNKWYKLSLRIDETDAHSAKQGEQNKFTGYSSEIRW